MALYVKHKMGSSNRKANARLDKVQKVVAYPLKPENTGLALLTFFCEYRSEIYSIYIPAEDAENLVRHYSDCIGDRNKVEVI